MQMMHTSNTGLHSGRSQGPCKQQQARCEPFQDAFWLLEPDLLCRQVTADMAEQASLL